MSYPLLRVHLDVLRSNMNTIVKKASACGLSVWGVTKGLSAPFEVASVLEGTGVSALADSRVKNIRRLKEAGIKKPFVLIRVPMLSELEDVLEYADVTVVSDVCTMRALSDLCEKRRKGIGVIVMTDMGDLREGFWPDEAAAVAAEIKKLSPLFRVKGVGVNFGCACGVLPSRESMDRFVRFGEEMESVLGYRFDVFSGGGTTRSLISLDSGLFPPRVNNIRIGEGYLHGSDMSSGVTIPWLRQDTMELEAELIEVRIKPTVPIGEVGFDAFGNAPVFEDRGNRKRGILAVGRQDVIIEGLTPLDEGVSVITASSDHCLVDIEDCPVDYKVGDVLRFHPHYGAMLSLSTSPYVTKVFE